MKLFKYMMVGAIAALGFAPSAYAFHSGGVGECEGCHSMHNSFEGKAAVTGMTQFSSGPFLLKASDQSGTCLNCHEASTADTAPTGYHISTKGANSGPTATLDNPPVEQTPGGDFAWLKMTRTGLIRNTPTTWVGERQGHNIVAADFGYVKDSTQTVAPGGSYPSASLACSSCHDPHGKYRRMADGSVGTSGAPILNSGSYISSLLPVGTASAVGVYRLLGGVGYQPKSLSGSFAFTAASPDALSPGSYNGVNITVAGASALLASDRVAYGRGMSEWCSNCHAKMHADAYTSGTKGLVHPAGNGAKLTAAIVANYNAYVSSGIAGTPALAGYSALAPYEVGMATSSTADYSLLKSFQAAPVAAAVTNNVACISCHRAHASAFESSTRYYLGNEFMTVATAPLSGVAAYDNTVTENKINTAYSVLAQTNGYNGRPATEFGQYARNYCNKCHAKD